MQKKFNTKTQNIQKGYKMDMKIYTGIINNPPLHQTGCSGIFYTLFSFVLRFEYMGSSLGRLATTIIIEDGLWLG